jgi:hypothetical protein
MNMLPMLLDWLTARIGGLIDTLREAIRWLR